MTLMPPSGGSSAAQVQQWGSMQSHPGTAQFQKMLLKGCSMSLCATASHALLTPNWLPFKTCTEQCSHCSVPTFLLLPGFMRLLGHMNQRRQAADLALGPVALRKG